MPKRKHQPAPRDTSLSRERIVEAAIQLLDEGGERALTFRALAEHLETGAGAIYWHVANKHDLLTAASDVVVAQALDAGTSARSPAKRLRALAIHMFDAMDAHPWMGSALAQAPGAIPMARLFDRIGAQVRGLAMTPNQEWPVTSALVHYILGVGGQNAANSKMARERGLERSHALTTVADAWQELDSHAFPVATSMARQLKTHDDREDFMAGVDLLIAGVVASADRTAG
ncbi:TetR/AcrR family transcriptional regulator [Frateuria aurantia]